MVDHTPTARKEAIDAVLDVLKDGEEWKMCDLTKQSGLTRSRALRALQELAVQDRVKTTKKGSWVRTKEDILREENREEIEKWKDALAEAYRNGPYETMQRHSCRILVGLLWTSHYLGGSLENHLLRRDLMEMGAIRSTSTEKINPELVRAFEAQGHFFPKEAIGLEGDFFTRHYAGMVRQHIRTGYPEAEKLIVEMEEVLKKRSKDPPEIQKKLSRKGRKIGLGYFMDDFDHNNSLELDYALAGIVTEVMAGSVLKGECHCCPPMKGLVNRMREI